LGAACANALSANELRNPASAFLELHCRRQIDVAENRLLTEDAVAKNAKYELAECRITELVLENAQLGAELDAWKSKCTDWEQRVAAMERLQVEVSDTASLRIFCLLADEGHANKLHDTLKAWAHLNLHFPPTDHYLNLYFHGLIANSDHSVECIAQRQMFY
jgi:predicted nuclease with TOPRIM domain